MLCKSLVIPTLFSVVKAAEDGVQLEYRTATITQCFTRDGLVAPTPVVIGATAIVHKPAVTGGPIVVEVDAPNCQACGCPTCVHTVAYTTSYQAFCPTGLCYQDYVITERYSGMEAKPTMGSQSMPFGFTCDVQTCNSCGPEPVTATITYPVKDRPYINDITHPTAMPPASKPSKGDDYDNGSEYDEGSDHDDETKYYDIPDSDNGSKSEGKPDSPDVPVPAKKPEGEAMPVPMPKPDENNGFQSSVKPTSASGAEESGYPGAGDEHPVIVSGVAGRGIGIVSIGIAVVGVLFSL